MRTTLHPDCLSKQGDPQPVQVNLGVSGGDLSLGRGHWMTAISHCFKRSGTQEKCGPVRAIGAESVMDPTGHVFPSLVVWSGGL